MTKPKKNESDPETVVEEVIQESAAPVEAVIQDATETIQESAAVVEENIEPQAPAANPVTRGIDQLFERLDIIDQSLRALDPRLQALEHKKDQPIVNTQAEKKEVKENAPQEKPRSKRINIFRRSKS